MIKAPESDRAPQLGLTRVGALDPGSVECRGSPARSSGRGSNDERRIPEEAHREVGDGEDRPQSGLAERVRARGEGNVDTGGEPVGIPVGEGEKHSRHVIGREAPAHPSRGPEPLSVFIRTVAVAVIEPDDAVILDVVVVGDKDSEEADVDASRDLGVQKDEEVKGNAGSLELEPHSYTQLKRIRVLPDAAEVGIRRLETDLGVLGVVEHVPIVEQVRQKHQSLLPEGEGVIGVEGNVELGVCPLLEAVDRLIARAQRGLGDLTLAICRPGWRRTVSEADPSRY